MGLGKSHPEIILDNINGNKREEVLKLITENKFYEYSGNSIIHKCVIEAIDKEWSDVVELLIKNYTGLTIEMLYASCNKTMTSPDIAMDMLETYCIANKDQSDGSFSQMYLTKHDATILFCLSVKNINLPKVSHYLLDNYNLDINASFYDKSVFEIALNHKASDEILKKIIDYKGFSYQKDSPMLKLCKLEKIDLVRYLLNKKGYSYRLEYPTEKIEIARICFKNGWGDICEKIKP